MKACLNLATTFYHAVRIGAVEYLASLKTGADETGAEQDGEVVRDRWLGYGEVFDQFTHPHSTLLQQGQDALAGLSCLISKNSFFLACYFDVISCYCFSQRTAQEGDESGCQFRLALSI